MLGFTGAIMLIVPTPVSAVWGGKSLSHSYYLLNGLSQRIHVYACNRKLEKKGV